MEQENSKDLRLKDYLNLLKELKEMGVMNLVLTGGEPLLSPYFFEIGSAAREAGFVVRIKSNGYLIDTQIAQRIKEVVSPFNIDLSLHGANASTHDRQTGVKGSFARLMSNIPAMLSVGLRLQLNTPLTRWNEGEIEAMYHIADGFGLRYLISDRISPRDNGDNTPLDLQCSPEVIKKLFLIKKQRSNKNNQAEETETCSDDVVANNPAVLVENHCGAGVASVTVDPYGKVLPCVQWRRSVGNLHENTISDIWHGSNALKEVRKITHDVKAMVQGHGPEFEKSGFCPALAEMLGGAPDKVDPWILQRMEVLRTVS